MAHEPRLGYQKRQEKIEGQGSRCQQKSLTTIAVEEEATGNNWPTPRSRDWKGEGNAVERQDGRHRLDTLEAVVRFGPHDPADPNTIGNTPDLWATPRAEKLGAEDPASWAARNKAGKVHQMPLPTQVKAAKPKTGGILSPNWVEQLMGLPVGWTQVGTASTASAHSGTDASPPPSPSPSEPSTTY